MIAAMEGNEESEKQMVDWLNSLEPGLNLHMNGQMRKLLFWIQSWLLKMEN